MASLTDLPAEIRQQILRLIPGSMPDEIQLSQNGWPDPVNQLLATCKLLRADTIRLMGTWSFNCLVPRSRYIEYLPRLSRAKEALGLKNKIQKVRLLILAEVTIAHIRDPGNLARAHTRTLDRSVRKWIERCSKLPQGDIKTVVVDITPLPRNILESYPHLVPANLIDTRAERLISRYCYPVSHNVNRLNEHLNPAAFKHPPLMWRWETTEEGEDKVVPIEEPPTLDPLVSVAVGGRVGEGSRSSIEELRNHGAISILRIKNEPPPFVGTFYDKEIPTNLSLHRLVQRCGIQLNTGEPATDYTLDASGITLPDSEGPQQNEVEPSRDFSTLSPLTISKYSATAYYNTALADEDAARNVVLRLLAFAVDCRKALNASRHLEFLPELGPRPRYQLVHELSRDLGLVCTSIDGKYGTFDRVSSLVGEVTSRLHGNTHHELEEPMKTLSVSHNMDSL